MAERRTETRIRRLARSTEAAALAGLAHAGMLSVALLLLKGVQPAVDADDAEIIDFLADDGARQSMIIALNLIPLSIISFLWFIAVIRRRIGEREDKLFASVFLGSGILFAAMVLAGFAVSTAFALMYETTSRVADPDAYRLLRSVGQGFLIVQAPRLGAVFIMATSTLGRRTGALPRWLVVTGIVTAVTMLVNVTLAAPIPYLFPAWVAVVSATMIVRKHPVLPGMHG